MTTFPLLRAAFRLVLAAALLLSVMLVAAVVAIALSAPARAEGPAVGWG